MLINNAKVFRGGQFETGSIEFSKTITGFTPGPGIDVKGAYVVPALSMYTLTAPPGWTPATARRRRSPPSPGTIAATASLPSASPP